MDTELFQDLSDANNVLLLAPPGAEFSDDACGSMLTAERAERVSLVSVTLGQSPAQRLAFWETHVGGELPNRMAVIAMGATDEGASNDSAGGSETQDEFTVRWITDPADTLTLGIELTWLLSQWTAENERVVCCVYTLSELFQQAGYARTMKLLLRLLEWTKRLDASVHYHLDPEAHQDAVVDLLRPLFDAVVESQPDGDCQLERHETAQRRIAPLSDRLTGDTPLTQDAIFDLLSNRRRRELLYWLQALAPGESLGVEELVDRLVESERRRRANEPVDLRDQLAVSLRHHHLPRLADAGIVGYDNGEEVVRREWGRLLERWVAQSAFIEG